eukprot:17315-Amphidinium_carterae.1
MEAAGSWEAAVIAYESDKLAVSPRGVNSCRLAWWSRRAAANGVAEFPLTAESLKLAGADLKLGSYRSAALYLAAMKKEHSKRGDEWTSALEVELEDGMRSCERGQGPPKQAAPCPIETISTLSVSEPVVPWGAAGVLVASERSRIGHVEESASHIVRWLERLRLCHDHATGV